MLNRIFTILTNQPYTLPNLNESYVDVFIWENPVYLPANHTALRVRNAAGQTEYLSLSPSDPKGLRDLGFKEAVLGRGSCFINSFEDEVLIQGLRNCWNEIKESAEEKIDLTTNLKRLGPDELLNLAKSLSPDWQVKIKDKGKPSRCNTRLHSLDTDKMIAEIKLLKKTTTHWSFWSGSAGLNRGRHKCSSIVLHVLDVGGINKLTYGYNDIAGIAACMLSAGYLMYKPEEFSQRILPSILGVVAARAVGSAIDGYYGIDNFLDLIKREGQSSEATTIALKTSSMVLSAVVGTFTSGSVIPKLLSNADDVLVTQHASAIEHEVYDFPDEELGRRNIRSL